MRWIFCTRCGWPHPAKAKGSATITCSTVARPYAIRKFEEDTFFANGHTANLT